MADVKRLRPARQGFVKTPQCIMATAQFHPGSIPTHYIKTRAEKVKKYGLDPERCSHHSTVEINGQPYCTRHGSQVALAILLGEHK